jgi:head-tail adaptor
VIVFDPGELDRRITLEVRSVVKEPTFGSVTETWTPMAFSIAAKVLESSTEAGVSAGQSENVASYARPTRIWLRWRAGITRQDHRVRYGSRLLRIIGTAELGRRAGLELSCMEWSHE